jgi:hypothetical protein
MVMMARVFYVTVRVAALNSSVNSANTILLFLVFHCGMWNSLKVVDAGPRRRKGMQRLSKMLNAGQRGWFR